MQAWLLEFILNLAVKYLVKRFGGDTAADKLEAMVEKHTPLLPDPNPSIMAERNPNLSLPPERGGIPR